jgi:hypothetical protein
MNSTPIGILSEGHLQVGEEVARNLYRMKLRTDEDGHDIRYYEIEQCIPAHCTAHDECARVYVEKWFAEKPERFSAAGLLTATHSLNGSFRYVEFYCFWMSIHKYIMIYGVWADEKDVDASLVGDMYTFMTDATHHYTGVTMWNTECVHYDEMIDN